MTSKRIGLFLVLIALSFPLWGGGIAMRFVDITLEKVEPGVSFNLRTLKNLPLVVVNQDTERPVDILVETVIPDANEMKNGYEPIPNPAWIQIVPNRFRLGPKASAAADVLVTIPEDQKLIGHHYEAIIWAHTETRNRAATAGVMFETGLRTRMRMSIGTMGPESLQREKALKKLATINTNFSITPDNLFVTEPIPVGQKIDLKADRRASIKVINQSDDPVGLRLSSAPPDPNNTPQIGYVDAPDYKWLTVQPGKVDLAGNSIKEMKLSLNVPNKPEYRGKKYMFIIQTTLSDQSLPLAYNNMLYITTAP
jgi:hypothetical protein